MRLSLAHALSVALALALSGTGLAAHAVDPSVAAESILQRTNAFRKAQGVPALRGDAALKKAAHGFARYMAETGRYGHTADGRQPPERAAAQGYEYCMIAENLAFQYRSAGFPSAAALAEAFVEGWKGSPEHRRNMTEAVATEIGVGVARGRDGRYFAVQLFGRPESAAVRFDVYNRAETRIEYRAGGRDFWLSPHEVRTHRTCGPTKLTISRSSRAEPFIAEAEDGARYTVLDDRIATRSPAH